MLLLRAFADGLAPGCPSVSEFEKAAQGQPEGGDEHLQTCPRCRKADEIRRSATGESQPDRWRALLDDPLRFRGRMPLLVLADENHVAVKGAGSQAAQELAVPPFDPSRPYPAFWLPHEEHKGAGLRRTSTTTLTRFDETQHEKHKGAGLRRLRLFLAHIACRTPESEDVIDGAVVQECLDSPNRGIEEYQPPKIVTQLIEARKKSKLPGQIAGVTRVETMTEHDSWLDIVPSELALGVEDEDALLQKLLLEKPLVFKHERDRDIVPKHRALICFLVEAPEDEGSTKRRSDEQAPRPYVYAKRQAFDLLRDLREALERLPQRDQVDFEITVFVLRSFYEDAVVHRQFDIRQFPPRLAADESLNRFDQMVAFAALLPGYFVAQGHRMEATSDAGSHEIVDPRVERFFQRRPQQGKAFHAVYVVAIGSLERLLEFIPAGSQDVHVGGSVRRGVMLIATDTRDMDLHSAAAAEPTWSCSRVRNLQDAARTLANELREKSLTEIQQEFLEMVIGKAEQTIRFRRWLRLRGLPQGAGSSRDSQASRGSEPSRGRSSSQGNR
jgi:hypothetical protein